MTTQRKFPRDVKPGSKEEQIIELLKHPARYPYKTICKKVGCSRAYAVAVRQRHDLPRRSLKGRIHPKTKKIIKALNSGKFGSMTDIARELNVSRESVYAANDRYQLGFQTKFRGTIAYRYLYFDNKEFVQEQIEAMNCTIWEYLNSLVTDARLEEEENALKR